MRARKAWLALPGLLWAGSVCAVNAEHYDIPYFQLSGEYLVTDHKRDADPGIGVQAAIGVPLVEPGNAVELRFFEAGYQRHLDGLDDYQNGLFVDYVRDFRLGGVQPYAALGLGLLQEDVNSSKTTHAGLAVGGGAFVPLGWHGIGLRLDARLQGQPNKDSAPGANSLLDYVVNLGVQVPMGWFYDRAPAAPTAEECPLAVVDPETGRRDCIVDSDHDGVPDTVDQCPGTPPGARVDASGCPKVDKPEGYRPEIPDSRRVTFLEDSPTLTDEGRATLDQAAQWLKAQSGIKVEIAGHSDSVGSKAYNTLLSQRRADAVRDYLIGKGIDGARLTAVGYGDLEPVASNATEEGRKANRRVEFRVSE